MTDGGTVGIAVFACSGGLLAGEGEGFESVLEGLLVLFGGGFEVTEAVEEAEDLTRVGAGGGAGFVPKTCEEAHGVEGCCAPDGKGGWYSQNDLFGVTAFTCKAGEVCSWTPGQMLEGIYDCVVGTTPKVDPKGKFPYLCGLPKIEGTCQ